MAYHPNTVYDYLGEEQSELNWTKMHERVFSPRWNLTRRKQYAVKMSSGENSGDGIWRGDNIKRWNLTLRKYHVAKFTAAKISGGKIFCGEISGSEIYCGEIPIFLVNFKSTENALFYIFKILINSIILLSFHVLQGETTYLLSVRISHSLIGEIGKT